MESTGGGGGLLLYIIKCRPYILGNMEVGHKHCFMVEHRKQRWNISTAFYINVYNLFVVNAQMHKEVWSLFLLF